MQGTDTPPTDETEILPGHKERLSYLLDVYKLYHGHINAMFNYFLLMAGLIVTEYVQSISKAASINPIVSAGIAVFGVIVSVIALLIHIRSRGLLDTIERGLKREEDHLFGGTDGFLNVVVPNPFYLRHKYQFPGTYCLFVAGFALMAAYSIYELSQVRPVSVTPVQSVPVAANPHRSSWGTTLFEWLGCKDQ